MSVEGLTGGRAVAAAASVAKPSTLSFRWLALTTTLATYALVILGGVVRVTESGDACPDWPRCHGELLPPLETQVLIEFSHRLIASVVGFLILAVALFAWRSQRHSPLIRWGAAAAVVLVGGQIVLGGATVINDLPSSMVTAHLALASALLATLVVITLASFELPVRTTSVLQDRIVSFRNLAAIAALATFALMLTGSYVSGSGAGLAFDDWPLFNGRLVPDGGRLAMVHATHRFASAAVGILVVYVAVRAWRTQRARPWLLYGTTGALALYVAQVFVGASNVWTLLQPAAVGAHLALAVALWAALVAVTFVAHQAAEAASRADEARGAAPLAAAAPAGGGS